MPRFVLLRLAYSISGHWGVGAWNVEENRRRTYYCAFSFVPPLDRLQVGYWTYITALLRLRREAKKGELRVKAKFPEPVLPNQLRGTWRVRGELLRPLWEAAKELEKQFAGVEHFYDPADTSDIRSFLRERVRSGTRFIFPEGKRKMMEGKIAEVLRVLEPLSTEEACFLLRSILSVYEPEGLKINKYDLVYQGQEMVLNAYFRLKEENNCGNRDGVCAGCRCRRVLDYEYA
ncbi:MAG: hypothetical protein QXR87_04110 [Candidatus Hadarchaeales archaeon]